MPRAKRIAHPGRIIRKDVIPAGVTVRDAAKRLGVGRPALSNLLNGRSSLSAEMAKRLEMAFGADAEGLLERQRDFDRLHRTANQEFAVRPYVPLFLEIESRQIEEWANRIEARGLLPVLLRMLIVSTHDDLIRLAFPGYDDAQRPGWDGQVEAGSATPWIPAGNSYWEFGTSRDPRKKANHDYRNALRRSAPIGERHESSFVFVTPRRWSGATDWARDKQRQA